MTMATRTARGITLTHLLLALCVPAFATACDDQKAKAPAAVAARVNVAEDRSLSTEEYAAKGLPALDRRWSPEDYQQVLKVLSELAKQDPCTLPRYGSPRSGEVFKHIASSNNIASITDKQVPVLRRAPLFSAYSGLDDIAELYTKASTRETGSFDAELVEWYALILRLHIAGARLGDEFMATIAQDDPTRARRLEARAKMREGARQSAQETLIAFRSNGFRKSELNRFVDHLRTILPELLPFLSVRSRQAILDHLEQLARVERDEGLKKALTEVIDASKAAK